MTAMVASAAWVAAHLDDADVRVVDVRDAWEYDGIGHLPGAVNVPFDAFRDEAGEGGMLPSEETWETLLSEAGVDAGDTLIAYDDTHGVFAARFLVTALLFGHEDVRLLDGDYSAWMQEYETTSEAPAVEETTYEASDPDSSPLVSYEDVEAALDTDAVVVDTRDEREFAAGHLPGAVNLDWRDLVDDETRGLKSESELRSILAANGVVPEARIVLYCNTARRISHTYLVLRHLGYERVDFYEGSLTEWEARGGPLETGE